MRNVFGKYARFYDSLYHDKDYEAEREFLKQVFAGYSQKGVSTILDLGCGTGGHAFKLAEQGFEVHGVDLSENMLAEAAQKANHYNSSFRVPVFQQGDIRTLDLGRSFDAVISMFAVISYMTTNADLLAALRSARRHLNPGGLFIFDVWSGFAVLTEKPTERCKVIETGEKRIVRIARPKVNLTGHTVDIYYNTLSIQNQMITDEAEEIHSMRFFFPLELEHYLDECEFSVMKFCPFPNMEEVLKESHWNLCCIAEAI